MPTSNHGVETGALHRDEQVAHAQRDLHGFIRDLLVESAKTGDTRDDIPLDELAGYCLHALAAVGNLASEAAVRRLVKVTITGMPVTSASPTCVVAAGRLPCCLRATDASTGRSRCGPDLQSGARTRK